MVAGPASVRCRRRARFGRRALRALLGGAQDGARVLIPGVERQRVQRAAPGPLPIAGVYRLIGLVQKRVYAALNAFAWHFRAPPIVAAQPTPI